MNVLYAGLMPNAPRLVSASCYMQRQSLKRRADECDPHLIIIAGLAAALAAPAHAQSIKKIGSDVHHTLQTAGKDTKEAAKEAGGATHHELQKAGNATKTGLGNATGIHKIGGSVGSAAQSVSRAGKHTARKAKHGVKRGSSKAHNGLTKAGKDAKASLKP